ncbi:NUDIX hydrolase [Chloroflexota bacterium]
MKSILPWCYYIAMIDELEEAISSRPKKALFQIRKRSVVGADRTPAAVLLPLFEKDGEFHILFTRRTDTVRDHKGQISFPGGAYEIQDITMQDTALREASEEIGLAPESVRILGELDNLPTMTSNYLITPYVGLIPWPYEFKTDPKEVEEVIEIPVPVLQDKSSLRHETETLDGKLITSYFYNYKGVIIWGATARILTQFLDIYSQVEKQNRS